LKSAFVGASQFSANAMRIFVKFEMSQIDSKLNEWTRWPQMPIWRRFNVRRHGRDRRDGVNRLFTMQPPVHHSGRRRAEIPAR
jgi:hypothetical protein